MKIKILKVLTLIMVLLPIAFSLNIVEPDTGAYLSGETQIEVLVEDENVSRVEIYWGATSRGWNKIDTIEEGGQGTYTTNFDTTDMPDSSNLLIRANAIECYSSWVEDKGEICWSSKTDIHKNITIDNTPPRVKEAPWIIFNNLGGNLTAKMQVKITDKLTGIKEVNKPVIDRKKDEYILDIEENLVNSTIIFEDGAGNQEEHKLGYILSNNNLTSLENNTVSEQEYRKKDSLENTGENSFYYYITHSSLEGSEEVDGLEFTGGLHPGESTSLETTWKGDWIELDQSKWTQNQEKKSTPDEVHFKANSTIKAKEILPESTEVTYEPRQQDLEKCSYIETEKRDLGELDPGEGRNLSLKSKVDCIGNLNLSEWSSLNDSGSLTAGYEYIANNFSSTLNVTYQVPEDQLPENYSCEEGCSKKKKTVPGNSTDVYFQVEEDQSSSKIKDSEDQETGVTGLMSGSLGESVLFEAGLGLFVLSIILGVTYFLKKRRINNETEEI